MASRVFLFFTPSDSNLVRNWFVCREPRTAVVKLICEAFPPLFSRLLRWLMKPKCELYLSFFSCSFFSAQSSLVSIALVYSRNTHNFFSLSKARPSGLRDLPLHTCTYPLDPVVSRENLSQIFWRPHAMHIACTMSSVLVFKFAAILRSQTLARAAHSTRSLWKVEWSLHFEFVGERPVWKMLPWILPGFSDAFCPLTWAWNSTVSPPPLSILRVCHLPHVSYLSESNRSCIPRMHVDRHLFTDSPSSCRSFPNWAIPVKLCSVVVYMIINCRLHQFWSSIPTEIRIPKQHALCWQFGVY